MRCNIQTITPPEKFPVARAEMLNFLHIDGTNPDMIEDIVFVEDLIYAATEAIGDYTGRAFITQTLKMIMTPTIKPLMQAGLTTWAYEGFPPVIPIWRPPCQQVLDISVVDQEGVLHSVIPSTYNINTGLEPALIRLNYGAWWPYYLHGWYQITFIAGYGDNAKDVPAQIRNAIRITVAQWYASRENLDYTLPTQAVDLVDDYAISVGDLTGV
jgi:uncharacterized phiE125 gp8 family phage protein